MTALLNAHWESKERGLVALSQDWFHTKRIPPLFLNPGEKKLQKIRRAPPFLFARRSGYCIIGKELIFLFHPPLYPNFSSQEEKLYVVGTFNEWEKAIGNPKWLMRIEIHGGKEFLILRVPAHQCLEKKPASFKFVSEDHHWLEVPHEAPNRIRDSRAITNLQINPKQTGYHLFHFWPPLPHDFTHETLLWKEQKHRYECLIHYGDWFLELQSDVPLGAIASGEETTFRIFAPRASHLRVSLFKDLKNPQPQMLVMEKREDGVWETTYPKNLHGYYYFYYIEGPSDNFSHFREDVPILDPYALAATSREGPGIILDRTRLPFPKKRFQPPHWHDLVIVETHIRDLLAKSPCALTTKERLGFKGLTRWLRSPDCYLRRLGANAVELQPIQENDSCHPEEYHWGYMNVNYFAPASTYATHPEHASQIEELQELVASFHEAGLAVILDVVYNHLGNPNPLLFIDKYYYLETDEHGNVTNWSGCGNDLRASTPMAKRLIIESLIHLIEMYDIDGFRFDLAELIGIPVLLEIEQALKKIKPSIILIAEPWSFRGHIGQALRKTGYASWNDGYRDFLCEYVKGNSNSEAIRYFLTGSPHYWAMFPAQTVNYVESHDDYCWMDRITENPNHDGSSPTARDRRRTHLMIAILMSSLGIPMLAEGQDMMRSKHGVHNTYQRDDLNALDYHQIAHYPTTHEYFRHWIHFRLSHLGRFFRQDSRPHNGFWKFFESSSSAIGVLYNADLKQGPERLLFVVNPHTWPVSIETKGLDPGSFLQIADQERLNSSGIESHISWREEIQMPPMSCTLWVNVASC